jgi:hypothetical protein
MTCFDRDVRFCARFSDADSRARGWHQHVLDLKSDNVATSQFAVDGQIEQRQITDSLLDLKLGPDRPNVFLP